MTETIHVLREALKNLLKEKQLEIVDVVPIPTNGDHMVRLTTLNEMIEDFEDSHPEGSLEYLIQIKPCSNPIGEEPITEPTTILPQFPAETLYVSTGKLNIPYLLKNGDLLLAAKDYAAAKTIYKTVLQSGECSGTALNRLGKCYEGEGQIERAISAYDESISYNPSIESYQRLIYLLIKLGRNHNAAETILRALNLKNLSKEMRFELHKACGNCFTRVQKLEEAEKHFLKALELNPSADDITTNLGALALQSRNICQAKRHFQDAIASNSRNFQALSGLGSCYIAENNSKLAYEYFVQSLEINLNNPTALFYLIHCAYELKSYAKAVALLQHYIEIAPVNANLLYSLASLQFHLGKISEAKINAMKIKELQPEHQGVKELLKLIERYTTSSS